MSPIKCIKDSCNPIRLLEAAELLEADQRKHEGGQSEETSSKGPSLEIYEFPVLADSGRSPQPAVALENYIKRIAKSR